MRFLGSLPFRGGEGPLDVLDVLRHHCPSDCPSDCRANRLIRRGGVSTLSQRQASYPDPKEPQIVEREQFFLTSGAPILVMPCMVLIHLMGAGWWSRNDGPGLDSPKERKGEGDLLESSEGEGDEGTREGWSNKLTIVFSKVNSIKLNLTLNETECHAAPLSIAGN